MKSKNLTKGGITALFIGAAFAMTAYAASTVVVTPINTQGWSTADTRPGGAVNYVTDSTSPYPNGALQLTTDLTTTSKAQYMHDAASTTLASVTQLSYWTKQVSAPFPGADASYQLAVDLNGSAPGGFTTFVYEPYENGAVIPGTWQQWDVAAGQLWSSRTVTDGTCAVVAGAGGAPFYSLAAIKAMCPNAIVLAFGVNIGSNNPGYNVYTDGVNFNGTTYNFEVTMPGPTSTDQCKNEGYKVFTNPSFKNQGKCIDYVKEHGGKDKEDKKDNQGNDSDNSNHRD